MNKLSSSKNQALLFSFCFFVFGTYRIYYHELWSDETQPWLLARDSNTYLDLLYNKRYEGHPNFWYTLLYPLTHLNFPVQSMQYLHLMLSTGAAYIFVRFAPFPLLFRILFCLGYFPLYEYGTISRIYAPGLVFIFGICALFHQRYQYWFWFCTLLFICTQTNFFGALFSGAIFILTIFSFWLDDRNSFWANEKPINIGNLLLGLTLVAVGFVLALLSVKTPPDNYFATGWHTYWFLYRFNETINRIWEVFFPIPEIKVAFWNTNVLGNFKLKVTLSGLILIAAFISLARSKRIFLFYGFLSLTMLAFFYFKYQGFIRHHGHLYIFFISSLWLMHYHRKQQFLLISQTLSTRIASAFLWVLLWVHVAVGAFATVMDLQYIFSGNKMISDYVRGKGGNYLWVVEDEMFCSTISAYTGQKLYYPTERKFGSYFQFNNHISYKPSYREMLNIGFHLGKDRKKNVVVVLYEDIPLKGFSYPIRKTIFRSLTISDDPNYYIYEIPFIPDKIP